MLRAYEHVLADAELPAPVYGELKRHLEWDGYTLDATGRLRSPPVESLDELPVGGLDDPAAIYEHINRIGRVMDADPAQAISGARALIEATTKLVLKQLGVAYAEHADAPALVKAAQKALGLHPETLAPTGKGSETVRLILSNLSQVAIGWPSCATNTGPTMAVPGSRSWSLVTRIWPWVALAPIAAYSWRPWMIQPLRGGVRPPLKGPRIDVQFHGYLPTSCPIGQAAWTAAG